MLLLSRRVNESIIIDGEINVQILSACENSGYVRLGIEAPEVVNVYCVEDVNGTKEHLPKVVITHKRRARKFVVEPN
ncbi:hypothetical protein ALO93_200196 [Pseudomonas amygdali pv. sesami]|nr:hypothetical protein ALO93_200196 [Pseudomonas amygdali pv. sesami]